MPRRNPSRRCKTTSYQEDSASDQERREEKQKTTRKRSVKNVEKTPKHVDSDESDFVPAKSSKEIPDSPNENDYEMEVEPEVNKRQRIPNSKPKRAKRSKPSPPKESQEEKKTMKVSNAKTASGQQLSVQQEEMLASIFKTFDKHSNDRFTLSDLIRVAEDHGQIYTNEEAENMLRFWDKSGTRTISRETFTELAIEAKFMVPS